ncbi:Nucleolin [Tupaia chinensis]|uniref:Nucleolin n=1 Tax=Tupaia chinensis TaxID=246437 RepID=L9JH56_TUPCH|nr:Nucleolin [Tupaia chinensis]
MAPPPNKVEEDSEDEEMSEDEDDSSGEEVIIPQKKKKAAVTLGKKGVAIPSRKTITPAKAVTTPGKKADTLGKALVETLEKPKRKDSKKDCDARTLLAKDLPYKVTQDELKEVFEDAMEIRIISKDEKSKGIAYIEFKTEADEEKTFEEKQGTEIDG